MLPWFFPRLDAFVTTRALVQLVKESLKWWVLTEVEIYVDCQAMNRKSSWKIYLLIQLSMSLLKSSCMSWLLWINLAVITSLPSQKVSLFCELTVLNKLNHRINSVGRIELQVDQDLSPHCLSCCVGYYSLYSQLPFKYLESHWKGGVKSVCRKTKWPKLLEKQVKLLVHWSGPFDVRAVSFRM